jgi:hypothetical protein
MIATEPSVLRQLAFQLQWASQRQVQPEVAADLVNRVRGFGPGAHGAAGPAPAATNSELMAGISDFDGGRRQVRAVPTTVAGHGRQIHPARVIGADRAAHRPDIPPRGVWQRRLACSAGPEPCNLGVVGRDIGAGRLERLYRRLREEQPQGRGAGHRLRPAGDARCHGRLERDPGAAGRQPVSPPGTKAMVIDIPARR